MTEEQLRELVEKDIAHHRQNGVDLNPYSTDSARAAWEHGFRGEELPLHNSHGNSWARGVMTAEVFRD